MQASLCASYLLTKYGPEHFYQNPTTLAIGLVAIPMTILVCALIVSWFENFLAPSV